MYDPILNRPMFQGPSSTDQGPSAPSAKGTGITSMVTAPDQGAQQLRSFANPTVQPTIRGFADGGYLSDTSAPMQGQNPLQASISQAIDQSLYQQPQGYADGGPVQHFQEGGVSSIFSRFADSLKEGAGEIPDNRMVPAEDAPRRRSIIPPLPRGASILESLLPKADPDVYRRTQQEEERLNTSPPGTSGPGISSIPIPPEQAPSRAPPQDRTFVNPYRDDNTSDRFEREQIERMRPPPTPPRPPEGRPTEERSTISTELNKIREERKAQSAADRREW